MNITEDNTQPVVHNFGRAVDYYHQNAGIQKQVAGGLISSLEPWKEILPEGPVLEIGCGTGFLTEKLIPLLPGKEFVITDASEAMLEYCKARLEAKGLLSSRIHFRLLDASEPDFNDDEVFSLIISNFVIHWLKDPALKLEKIANYLAGNGLMLASTPGNQSFGAWYENCLELGLPHTANPLPDVEEMVIKLSMGPMQIDYYENDLYEEFDSALNFFRHLKNLGAGYSRKESSLSQKQFRLLCRHWDKKSKGKLRIKWHIVYLAAKKDPA